MTIPLTTPRIRGTMHDRFDHILTPEALTFIAQLDGAFAGRRAELLAARRARTRRISAGEDLGLNPMTEHIRADDTWRVAPPAPGLTRRWAEITGPATPKMTINALNSGADTWMADLEDATAPGWQTIIDSQITLYDAIRDELAFTAENGKRYEVTGETPTIIVRPRGWHLCEKHITIDSRPLSASLVDFGLYFFHNAAALIERGQGPYFYLPKIESHLEARLWNDVFVLAQDLLGIPRGTIRATVLIETLPAAFEMDEILYELREHSSGLNAGRWDYIFSFIRTFADRGPGYVLSDRGEVTMTTPFLRAYTQRLVATCHARGAHAIGGMAAFVPDRSDPAATATALVKVRADKEREAGDGFDGSWVAHPGLVDTCRAVFDTVLAGADDQRGKQVERGSVIDLTATPPAHVTLAGVRTNISAALRYVARWVGGAGAVAIDSLMEDAATVEISRAQLWQWIRWQVRTEEGPTVTRDLVASMIDAEAARLSGQWAPAADVAAAVDVLTETALGGSSASGDDGAQMMPGFFTPYAYVRYLTEEPMTGALGKEDLRQSEHVPGLTGSGERAA